MCSQHSLTLGTGIHMWYHPSVPCCSSFHSPLCQFVYFPAVLLGTFFSDTEFCICQCINRTTIVKIFCLASGLGSSNQLGPLVMMGWRRQLRPRAYKCSQGPKILLAAQEPSDSVCLNFSFFQCACAALVWFASYFWGEWVLENCFCDADMLVCNYFGSWVWAAGIGEVFDRSLVNNPCGCGWAAWGIWWEKSWRRVQFPAPKLLLQLVFTKVMKVALLGQLHLQPCSASTVKHGPVQSNHGEKPHRKHIKTKEHWWWSSQQLIISLWLITEQFLALILRACSTPIQCLVN